LNLKSEIDKAINLFISCETHFKEQEKSIECLRKQQNKNPTVTTESLKKNIVIHGLNSASDNPTNWFETFCTDNLQTRVETENVNFKKTKSGLWICIATLKTIKEKAKIFGNCHKLKKNANRISICDDNGGKKKPPPTEIKDIANKMILPSNCKAEALNKKPKKTSLAIAERANTHAHMHQKAKDIFKVNNSVKEEENKTTTSAISAI